MKKTYVLYLLGLLFFWLIAAKRPNILALNEGLTAQQKAGKNIYTKGIGVSDVKVIAQMSGVQVPATIMPCINCHRADGTGNPEGGIVPSNITWTELTKSYGGIRQNKNKRPPYTLQSLRKVITTGRDSGGNQLHTTMPQYNMSREDLDNLIEYIKILGTDRDIGLTDNSIKIGIALPEKDMLSNDKNEAVKKVVTAYCAAINSKGGVYNRKIDPIFLNYEEGYNKHDFFMILGFGDNTVASYANKESMPALLSFSEERTVDGLNNQHTFYVYPSLTAQSLSLVDFSKQNKLFKNNTKVTVVYFNDETRKSVAKEVATYCFKNLGKQPEILPIDFKNIEEIVGNGNIITNSLLFFIGPKTIGNKLLLALHKEDKLPYVLLPGSLSGIDVYTMPIAFQKKIFIEYPTWISEQTLEGFHAYQNLNKNYPLDHHWKRNQLDMLSMLLTTEECLKRVGKNLSRNNFIETMEGLFEYSNGLSPSITYNLNRRVGNSNVYIIGFNAEEKKMQLIATVNSKEK